MKVPVNSSSINNKLSLTLVLWLGFAIVMGLSGCGSSSSSDPTVSISDVSVSEGDSGTTDLVFTITASKSSSSDITVTYATSDGTATAGSDYENTSGTINIPAGSTSFPIAIPVMGEKIFEDDETLTLTLSAPSGATLGTSSAIGTILNDDVQFISRVSVNAAGEGGNESSEAPDVSTDGRYVVFTSLASNLVDGDTNDAKDIFVRDMDADTIVRVSVDSSGNEGNGASRYPSISGDGRYVVFRSAASNLVTGDSNGMEDVFLHDLDTGTTELISVVDGTGVQGDNISYNPTISTDGNFVAFVSYSALVNEDTNGVGDVYVRDLVNGTTTRVSLANNGDEGNDYSGFWPAISGDGRYVAFWSHATNLVTNDSNVKPDVFVRDLQSNTTIRASVANDGTQIAIGAGSPFTISNNGRLVAFTSLVANDSNNTPDVFLRDLDANTTTRVSVDSSGVEGDNNSIAESISADSNYVSFFSYATNLVANDDNGFSDIFLHNRQTAETTRISVSWTGDQGNDNSSLSNSPSHISGDGRYVVFMSYASNLVSDDNNMRADIFRVRLSALP